MKNDHKISFRVIDWKEVPATEHPGATGTAYWHTINFAGLRLRIVEYSEGYLADHWCRKGHIVHCLEGEVTTQMEDGTEYRLVKGSTYVVSDDLSSHRSVTMEGVKLLIIDGDFLR